MKELTEKEIDDIIQGLQRGISEEEYEEGFKHLVKTH